MTARLCMTLCALALCALVWAPRARAEAPLPVPLQGIEIVERLGQSVPLDATFVDQGGATVRLRDYMRAGRPVVLTLNYYACPTLCSLVLNGLLEGMREVGFTLGRDFEVVTVSIDPRESPALAAAKRKSYLDALPRSQIADGPAWPFLTGTEASVRSVADAVGFRYRYDAETRQYAHAAGIFVLTPDGRLSRTLYGISFPRRDLRLALVEASRGGISAPVERLLLFCYHYDPQMRRYGLTPMGVMRIGALLTLFALGTLLVVLWRRERRPTVVHD